MLFNSSAFIFAFLPLTVAMVFLFTRWGKAYRAAIASLVLASWFFYAWWNPVYLGLLVSLLVANYWLGILLSRPKSARGKRILLVLGLSGNLLCLGYFKYTNFLIANINEAFGTSYYLHHIVLPLGISFFIFQKIAYLVDCYKGEVTEHDFLNFALFVSFFPQLIAGPIVHHKEVIPQFADSEGLKLSADKLALGCSLFSIGLFKKIFMADKLAGYVTPVFALTDGGHMVSFAQAWLAALAYTFEIYFDFSGYSDMAVGCALMVGIKLPWNFLSPYRSTSFIEFWRRWHVTLSRFLRDYVYIPLGGNRKGKVRRYLNLLMTMLLGGLWHGANWTFVIWGGLHGVCLALNHGIREVTRPTHASRWLWTGINYAVTFLVIIIGWVVFRSETIGGAVAMLRAMADLRPPPSARPPLGGVLLISLAWMICVGGWNTARIYAEANRKALYVLSGVLFAVMLAYLNTSSTFIYFQF